jgi:hypothetical protein
MSKEKIQDRAANHSVGGGDIENAEVAPRIQRWDCDRETWLGENPSKI